MNPVLVIRSVTGWTQSRLAGMAGTSQPTIAAYEGGSKSPTWRTITGIAQAAGLTCYPFVGVPFTRDQARSLVLHQAIAEQLSADPERVLSVARTNIAVMVELHPDAAALLDEWDQVLQLPVARIVSTMLDPSEHGRDLRQVTPFAGVLTAEKRTEVYRRFRAAA
jgi:transcriptional regulator with XRE-family HTH domain